MESKLTAAAQRKLGYRVKLMLLQLLLILLLLLLLLLINTGMARYTCGGKDTTIACHCHMLELEQWQGSPAPARCRGAWHIKFNSSVFS